MAGLLVGLIGCFMIVGLEKVRDGHVLLCKSMVFLSGAKSVYCSTNQMMIIG